MTTLTLQLPSLHPGQRAVWQDGARFQVMACGRRWGKTRMGALRCIWEAVQGRRAWWVAPSYKMAAVGWRIIRRLAVQIPHVQKNETDRLVELPGGGSVQVRSADEPDSLRGEGLDFLVVDECAFMREAAWTEALRPALSDRQGRAVFISTPKGRNWFWQMWRRGKGGDPDWHAWQLPTVTNPFIAPSEVEAARRDLPERVFAQEYEAQFLEDAGIVFRGVSKVATWQPAEPEAGRQYVVGVDWGKHEDFTVFSVLDAVSKRQVYLDRSNQIDYTLQVGRLRALCDRFQPGAILAEANSMGEPLIEKLLDMNLPVQPFTTTNATKKAVIEGLALGIERGDIGLLDDDVQTGELQAYAMERTATGLYRFGAPEGMHDDTVMALALAWEAASVSPTGGIFA